MKIHKFALLGFPLGHSMSPFIHKRLFELSDYNSEYELIAVPGDELRIKFTDFLNIYAGLNVTIPHKRAVIPFLSDLDENARLFGAVNTIHTGLRKGFNTDGEGFLGALKMAGIPLTGRIVVCGAGGAGRVMALLAAKNTRNLTLAVRESELPLAATLSSEIEEKTGTKANVTTLHQIAGDISLLINATPAGMYPHPQEIPILPGILAKTAAVFDAVYNPKDTILLQKAAANGAKTAGGMPMLVFQAAAAHKIWGIGEYNSRDLFQLIEDATVFMTKNFNN